MATTEWKPHRLDDLGFVGRGKSRHRPRNDNRLYGGTYPFVQTADIMAADPYITSYAQTYSEFGLQQSKMWPADTLCITIAGANTAKTAILKIEACFPDSVVGFIPDQSKADLHFVKYSLDLLRHRFLAVSRGATQDNLSLDKLLSFPIAAPLVDHQRRIGSILSAFDDLLDNNRRRTRILEGMARSIYREWFVNFRFPGHEKLKPIASPLGNIPMGWRVTALRDVTTKIGSGATPRGGKGAYTTKGVSLIRSLNIYDYQFEFSNLAFINDEQAAQLDNVVVQSCDVLLNITGASVARCSMVPSYILPARVNQHVAIVRADPRSISPYYLLDTINNDQNKQKLLGLAQGGATREALTKDTISNFPILLPPRELVFKYGEIAGSLHIQRDTLDRQTQNLRRTRDLLLPRLLSGQASQTGEPV